MLMRAVQLVMFAAISGYAISDGLAPAPAGLLALCGVAIFVALWVRAVSAVASAIGWRDDKQSAALSVQEAAPWDRISTRPNKFISGMRL